MGSEDDYTDWVPAYFNLAVPTQGATPVLVEVPHAGLDVPDGVRHQLCATQVDLERDADIYVDQLCADAAETGATLLTARASRYVVDLNRAADDVDRETVSDRRGAKANQARGVVWRMTTTGVPSLTRPLTEREFANRLAEYYTPYHDTLGRELARLRERFGFATLVAAHSMPSVGRGARGEHRVRRADIVPGTRGRTTADARFIEMVDAHFRAAGLTVRHDDPYRGGYTTGHYGRPESGVHAVQIEINRALYVDETTRQPREGNFERLQRLMTELFDKLGRLDLR
ncbi:MAG: N-formylglutamate amidohydrolase [Deltaproteobacteria bacterium]|nr:MAG: N-formylglutamate amidohydrolase [Deltaproteobacteria bacterium]